MSSATTATKRGRGRPRNPEATTPVQVRATPYELACLDIHGDSRADAIRHYVARYDRLMEFSLPDIHDDDMAILAEVLDSNPAWHPDACPTAHGLPSALAATVEAHGRERKEDLDELAETVRSWTPVEVFAIAYAIEARP